jgi:endonuclease/exonuclease/phosphatase family metal-dependent hydrolase
MPTFRKITRRLFIVLNILVVFLFLLACCNGFLHPEHWWFVSILGLLFPLLLLLTVVGGVAALCFASCRRWAILSLVALLLGWSNIHALLAFHPGKRELQPKASRALRIMTWNVRSFDEFITKKKGASGHRQKMLDFIGEQDADVLCMQEFYVSKNTKDQLSNIAYIQQVLHYPYYVFSHDYGRPDGPSMAGVVLFSRLPIIDSSFMHYTRPEGAKATESLISADLLVGGDTIRVYTTHLQSVLFHTKDFHDIQIIKNVDDSIFAATKSIVKKLRYAFMKRGDQASETRAALDKSPYPAVITGDFNDVPNSYTYFTIRGGWQDAWIARGFGIGRSYVNISPTLRIDYILADRRFEVLQCKKFAAPWSDHHPFVADLQLP